MKKWNEVFFWCMVVFLLAIVALIFYNEQSFIITILLEVLSLTSFLFFLFLAIRMNNLFRKKEQEIEELKEKNENAFSRFAEETKALSEFASTEFSPEDACREVSKLINLFGKKWWDEYGEKILAKLFFERYQTKTDEDQYLKDFLKELAREDYQEELISLYFSMLPAQDLSQILAEIYRDYAVDLINGGDTVLLGNLTLMLKKTKPRGLEETFSELGKIIANLYELEVRQKILAIVKAEVEEAQA